MSHKPGLPLPQATAVAPVVDEDSIACLAFVT